MKRILVIQDISCVGRCSMTVSLPILSAFGVETCILPTAVLSTHTGGFTNPAVRDLSDTISAFSDHWLRENITFDGILVGYLGSVEAVEAVKNAVRKLCPKGLVIVDPAMADNGKLYSGLSADYPAAVRKLCAIADIILPNVTEAELLTGEALSAVPEFFGKLPGQNAVVTGQPFPENRLATWIWDGIALDSVTHSRRPGHFHGTGDIFAACFAGSRLGGASLKASAEAAAAFTAKAVSLAEGDERFGLPFELLLSHQP